MNEHQKKMIAPIVVTIIMIVYYVAYFGLLMWAISGAPRILLGILPALLAGVTIYVCIQRIKEIRSGEEDDLDNY